MFLTVFYFQSLSVIHFYFVNQLARDESADCSLFRYFVISFFIFSVNFFSQMRLMLRNRVDGLEYIEKQRGAAIFLQKNHLCFSVLHEFPCLKCDRVGRLFEVCVSASHVGKPGLEQYACLHPRFLFCPPLPYHRRLYRNFV